MRGRVPWVAYMDLDEEEDGGSYGFFRDVNRFGLMDFVRNRSKNIKLMDFEGESFTRETSHEMLTEADESEGALFFKF